MVMNKKTDIINIFLSTDLPFCQFYLVKEKLTCEKRSIDYFNLLNEKNKMELISSNRITVEDNYLVFLNALLTLEIDNKVFSESFMYKGISTLQFSIEGLLCNSRFHDWFNISSFLTSFLINKQVSTVNFYGALNDFRIDCIKKILSATDILGEFFPSNTPAGKPKTNIYTEYKNYLNKQDTNIDQHQGKVLFASHPRHLGQNGNNETVDTYTQPLNCLCKIFDSAPLRIEVPHWYQIQSLRPNIQIKSYLNELLLSGREHLHSLFFTQFNTAPKKSEKIAFRDNADNAMKLLNNSKILSQIFTIDGLQWKDFIFSILHDAFVKYPVIQIINVISTAEKIITQLKPKALVSTFYVGAYEKALTFFAQQKGIPTFGLQFGARISWEYKLCMIPSFIESKTRLLKSTNKFILPETIICYSKADKNYFVNYCKYPENRVISAGNDWRIFPSAPFRLPDNIKWESQNKRKILYLPFTVEKNIEQLLADQLDKEKDQIIIKSHPIKVEPAIKALNFFKEHGFEVNMQRTHLHALMNSADIIVSFFRSTATYEALFFDKPIIVYAENNNAIKQEIIGYLPRLEDYPMSDRNLLPSTSITPIKDLISSSGYKQKSFKAFQEDIYKALTGREQKIKSQYSKPLPNKYMPGLINIKNLETPIVFMIFNRPQATERVFETIRKVRPKNLLIIADGPRANAHVIPEDTLLRHPRFSSE